MIKVNTWKEREIDVTVLIVPTAKIHKWFASSSIIPTLATLAFNSSDHKTKINRQENTSYYPNINLLYPKVAMYSSLISGKKKLVNCSVNKLSVSLFNTWARQFLHSFSLPIYQPYCCPCKYIC